MTDQFQFDTSGYVGLPATLLETAAVLRTSWHDLSPGVQGCIAGVLEELDKSLLAAYRAAEWGSKGREVPIRRAFSDLHPDTLVRIIADWERWDRLYPRACDGNKVKAGEQMWELRQAQHVHRPDFPPRTPYLNDEGKVCLR